ncbi:HAD-IA family hydrolase [Roseibium sp.]|uniref:HAD-IA family hydrolase n=1 Tax=Roseibium sp. TaxID=1936156 RepID=UPI003A9775BF
MNRHYTSGSGRRLWPDALLFDLDGTLIDSVPDIATSINKLLVAESLDPLSRDEVRGMIGNGVAKLVERAFRAREISLAGDHHDVMTARMLEIYQDHLTDQTQLMKGARDVLHSFHQAGVKLAVVTNKPEAPTRQILDHFGLSDLVASVVGGDTGPARKPEPDMLFHALKAMDRDAARAVMIGDSPADIGAAKAAGIASVAVEGGYTPVPARELGADVVIASLAELPVALDELKELAGDADQGPCI